MTPVEMLWRIVSMNCVRRRNSSYVLVREAFVSSRFRFIAFRSAVIRLKEATRVPNSSLDW